MRDENFFMLPKRKRRKEKKKKRNFEGAFFSKKSQLMERVCC